MITFVGDCEKHDLVLATAYLVRTHLDEKVTIVSDNMRSYKYFNGEVSGIRISDHYDEEDGVIIYDCHEVIIPDDLENEKVVLVMTHEKPSLEMAKELELLLSPKSLVVIENEGTGISRKYISTYFECEDVYEYLDSPERRIGWVHDNKISFKKLDSDFRKSVSDLVRKLLGVQKKEEKAVSSFLKKRG